MAGGGATNAFEQIEAPPATAPRLGLLASAIRPVPTGAAATRWINGIVFETEECANPDGVWWDCADEGDGPTGVTPQTCGEFVRYRPWKAEEEIKRPTVPNGVDYDARVRRRLVANQGRKMEAELWSGAVAQASGFPNTWLNNSGELVDIGASIGATSIPLVYGLGELQQFIADEYAGRGMIHATVRTVNLWWSNYTLRREGNVIYDTFDNIIVPGVGYDGSGPDGEPAPASGDTQWAYCSPLVQVLEDRDITIRGGDNGGADGIDRDLDDVYRKASRIVAAFYSACPVGAVNINLCSPCCTASGS